MVYCVKCGTQNEDDADVCAKCGASLTVPRERWHYKRVEDECFGIPRGGTVLTLLVGVIIILWGGVWLLQQLEVIGPDVQIWPFVVIMFGLLFIVGALYGLKRRL